MVRRIYLAIAYVVIFGSVPVSLGSIAWGFKLMAEIVPIWFFLIQCGSVIVVALGLAFLIDNLEQPNRRKWRD